MLKQDGVLAGNGFWCRAVPGDWLRASDLSPRLLPHAAVDAFRGEVRWLIDHPEALHFVFDLSRGSRTGS